MNRKISLGSAVAAIIICVTITICMTMVISTRVFSDKVFYLKERENMYDKIAEIDRIVRQSFNGNIDEKVLMDHVSNGYINGLGDKYSTYFTTEQFSALTTGQEGKVVGIGIDAKQDPSGYIKVVDVYPNSSAMETGIKQGDLIVKVDGEDITADNYKEKLEMIQGEAGTKLNITVRSENEDKDIDVTRRLIEIPTVKYKIYNDIAHIKISKFNNLTPDQFKEALRVSENKGVKAYVFDVRNNPGGIITSVTEVLDMLLPKGNIVSATYKNGSTKVLAQSDSKELVAPMTVLINEKSASAAELFAQALKDYGKASVVGTTSYGKGLMQMLYPLSDGSALDLTIAKYNPPKSPNFDGKGVVPDFEVTLTPEETQNFENLTEKTDPQLAKAISVSKSFIIAKTEKVSRKKDTNINNKKVDKEKETKDTTEKTDDTKKQSDEVKKDEK